MVFIPGQQLEFFQNNQSSICQGDVLIPLWYTSIPKFSLTPTGFSQKYIKNTLLTPL